MKYVYPAIFSKDKELPDTWCVEFPDVEGAITQGKGLFEAMEMAEDALNIMLMTYEDFKAGRSNLPMKNRIVDPTPIDKVVPEIDEYSTSAFVTLIKADTDAYRKMLKELKAKESAPKTDLSQGAA